MNPHGCIAHPCEEKRVKGSGFCKQHKKEHKQQGLKKKLQDAIKASQAKER